MISKHQTCLNTSWSRLYLCLVWCGKRRRGLIPIRPHAAAVLESPACNNIGTSSLSFTLRVMFTDGLANALFLNSLVFDAMLGLGWYLGWWIPKSPAAECPLYAKIAVNDSPAARLAAVAAFEKGADKCFPAQHVSDEAKVQCSSIACRLDGDYDWCLARYIAFGRLFWSQYAFFHFRKEFWEGFLWG